MCSLSLEAKDTTLSSSEGRVGETEAFIRKETASLEEIFSSRGDAENGGNPGSNPGGSV